MDRIPSRLKPGDTVAIVSPSFGAVGAWPHRTERGAAYLRELGLEVKVMPNAARNDSWISAPAAERVDDLHQAFADPEVKAILCGIGGNHCNQLLPLLDFDLIAANPKIFQGFSDITVLLWAFMARSNLRTFYGPALVANLAELPTALPFTDEFLRAAWFGPEPIAFRPSTEWTEEFLDWDQKADNERPREMRTNEGWVPVRPGAAEGPLVAGCLETVCWHLLGTQWWPDLHDCILLLETSEEAPSPGHVDAYLTDLEQAGVFDQISALLIGRPMYYSDEDKALLWKVVEGRTRAAGIPVLANVDASHTDPMLTLPMGARARVDVDEMTFAMLEPATAES